MGAEQSRTCLGPSEEDVKKYRELEAERNQKSQELRNELQSKQQLTVELEKLRIEFAQWKLDTADQASVIERMHNFETEANVLRQRLLDATARVEEMTKVLEDENNRLVSLQTICDDLSRTILEARRGEEASRQDVLAREAELDGKEREILDVKAEKAMVETKFAELMKRYVENETELHETRAALIDKDATVVEGQQRIADLSKQLLESMQGIAGKEDEVVQLMAQFEETQKKMMESNEARAASSALESARASKSQKESEEERQNLLQAMEDATRKATEEVMQKERELFQKEKDRIVRDKDAIEQSRDRERNEHEAERARMNIEIQRERQRIEAIELEKEKLRLEIEKEHLRCEQAIERERSKLNGERDKLKELTLSHQASSEVPDKPSLMLNQLYSIKMTIAGAKDLFADEQGAGRNPYCTVLICHKGVEQASQKRATKPCNNTTNPEWNQVFGFITERQPDYLQFDIWDYDEAQDDAKLNLGTAILSLENFYKRNSDGTFDDALPLTFKTGEQGSLQVRVECKVVPQAQFRWLTGYNHPEIARIINNTHADVETKDVKYGRTALASAVFRNQYDLARTLLLANAAVDPVDNEGLTPLLLASIYGHAECVEVLIQFNANLESKDANQRTALMHACKSGYAGIARLLIQAGADIEAVDSESLTALMLTAAEGQLETLKLLVDAGANLEAANPNGITALIIAAIRDQADTAKFLLACGANPRATDMNGLNALMVAAVRGNVDVTRALLDYKADIEAADDQFGRTPLMYAAHGGNYNVASILLDHGARTDVMDKDQRTALQIAIDNQHRTIINLLEKNQPLVVS